MGREKLDAWFKRADDVLAEYDDQTPLEEADGQFAFNLGQNVVELVIPPPVDTPDDAA